MPKNIRYENCYFTFDNKYMCYKGTLPSILNNYELSTLNEEVEIIEDEDINIQDIEDLLKIEDYEADKTDIRLNRDKINDLIKAVKKLDKEIKKYEK